MPRGFRFSTSAHPLKVPTVSAIISHVANVTGLSASADAASITLWMNEVYRTACRRAGIPYAPPETFSLTEGVAEYAIGTPATAHTETALVTVELNGGTGNLTVTIDGVTSGNIAHNANAATVTAAIEAMSNIGSGNVVVTGTSFALGMTFTFAASLALENVAAITLNLTGITGDSPAASYRVETAQGSEQLTAPFPIVDVRHAQITDGSVSNRRLRIVDEEFILGKQENSSQGNDTPQYICFPTPNYVMLWPPPSANTLLTLRYVRSPKELNTSSATALLETTPSAFDETHHMPIIANGAIGLAYQYDQRLNGDAQLYEEKFNLAVEELSGIKNKFGSIQPPPIRRRGGRYYIGANDKDIR